MAARTGTDTGPRHRRWQDMTSRDFAALDTERAIALLPLGAIEQHGPHLPVAADTLVAAGVIDRVVALMPAELTVLVLPLLPIGKSSEHEAFPGTLSLSTETALRLWTDVAESVHQAGVRKLVLFNSHGGQQPLLDVLVRDLRLRNRMLAVAVNTARLGVPGDLFAAAELQHGSHGGSVDTSLLLHLAPDLVVQSQRRRFDSLTLEMAGDYQYLPPEGPVGFGWQAQDLNLFGACGNAADADAERGAKVVEFWAQAVTAVLQEVDRFPLDALKDRV